MTRERRTLASTAAVSVPIAAPQRWLRTTFFSGQLQPPVTGGDSSSGVSPEPWQPSPIHQAAWLLGLVAICLAIAAVGGAATSSSVSTWYPTLAKPTWTPPDWLFGPVWTALYLMMAVAAWLVWRRVGWPAARPALVWFGVQLALNLAWSAVFFGVRSPGMAFGEILVLWLAIVGTAFTFWGSSKAAALLLVPYLAWTSFAAALNFAIWRMNT